MAEAARERPPTLLTPPVARLVASPPVGEPLRLPTRTSLERSFGVNLESVRVHGDARTGKIVDNMPARAFAYGTHVYLGSREQATDVALMAHEAAHVVQQRAMPRVQPAGEHLGSGALEQEAQRAGEAASQGESFSVRGRTAGSEVQGGILSWLEDKAWSILEELAPDLVPIVRQGIFSWLEEKITAAIQAVVDVLMAPVRAVGSAIDAIGEQFGELIAWIREAAARIAKGDCGAITEAATKIEQVLKAFAAPMIERITGIAKKVGDFFTGLWNRFGAPVWDFLKKIGGVVWEKIEQFASWLWKKTDPIRDLAARAWRWVKNKLGIGEGPEGQNGILQWVQGKASAVWEAIKAKIEPIKKPLLVVAGILVMLSPAGPIIAIGAVAVGLYKAVAWIRANLSTPDGVVRQREVLRTQIIPAITGAVAGVSGKLTALATSMSDKLGGVVGGLGQLVGAVAGSILNFAVSAVEWILKQATRLVTWATSQLTRLVDLATRALEGLSSFMQPVLGVLGKIVSIVGDVMQLPILFAGRVWNMIPACIRNPFVNFLVNHVLKHVPIFGELLADPEVWGKLRDGATRLVRQIFRDHDLKGAIRSAFELILTVFKIPVELVQSIYAKAKSAWEQIYRQPLAFLRNLLKAVRLGFAQFFEPMTFLGHLGRGLVEWLTGQLGQVNIRWPGDLSLGSVLGLVTDLLGLTIDKIFERLGNKIGKEKAAKLRQALDMLTGALGWVADLIREGPAGLWKSLVDRLGNLWTTVRDAISGWIVTKIVTSVAKRLLSMLDPTGIMAVVNSLIAVYDTIKFAVEYARKILEFVSSVLDGVLGIASGAIGAAAGFLEKALARAIPVAIGFLAQHAGFQKLGTRIRETVEAIRKKVEDAIDWLIDKAIQGMKSVLATLGLGKKEPPATSQAPDDASKRDKSFTIGKESHVLRGEFTPEGFEIELASGVFAGFNEKLLEIDKNWTPLRKDHPAGNLRAQLLKIVDRADALDARATKIRRLTDAATARARSQVLNDGIDQIAVDLRALCERFDITGIEAVTNYQSPPPHAPVYSASSVGFGRTRTTASAVLSFNTRPEMRRTNPQVAVPGTNVLVGGKRYQAGHLLAASLGGSNSDPNNFAPMSPGTNTTRGGMQLREDALRKALRTDVFPPWIVYYQVAGVYDTEAAYTPSAFEEWLVKTLGATPGASGRLLSLAALNANIDAAQLALALGPVDQAKLELLRDDLFRRLMMAFAPRKFSVVVRVDQAPEAGTAAKGGTPENVLPVSDSFPNHL
jgi:phage-related protein